MGLPQFTAEASLGRTRGRYRTTTRGGSAGAGGALLMQQLAALFPGPVQWPTMRCCRWAPMLGRFVCTSRRTGPWETCTCVAGMFGPVILCRDIVATQTAE